MSRWIVEEMSPMEGETVVVTGANSGLGYEATKAFADADATVVMACRSEERGEEAATDIRREIRGGNLEVRVCDLADLDSVATFAEGLREEADGIDVLCNNAGVMAIPRQETADGFEKQLGVNHLGHFALTGHLLPELRASEGESRVVTQSSQAHTAGEMDFSDLQSEREYGKWSAYGRSKLANLLFAYELQRRLAESGADLKSVACHPGYAATDLQFRGPREMESNVRLNVMKVANKLFGQSAERGALPMLYAATSDAVTGGEYVGPSGFMRMRGSPEFQESNAASKNEADAEQLWTVSEELTGVEYDFE
ncbi:oxidoreductase [Haloarcula salinisoli]|uniref:SDR family oxidoreductase n=1 Tax=Haloarcula salinisoli TaxID=2487746 RepID=A0A8J7YJA2_9EURY|nr:oxidoreductase [Halomicroarcula salinisoli]MBX0287048.1 SDR family oxidoreductase [Halomicroarcula salinisoli]MBX0304351.1 SDR family oxidoreductase [Halomicroarcula salinisoli]